MVKETEGNRAKGTIFLATVRAWVNPCPRITKPRRHADICLTGSLRSGVESFRVVHPLHDINMHGLYLWHWEARVGAYLMLLIAQLEGYHPCKCALCGSLDAALSKMTSVMILHTVAFAIDSSV